MNASVISTAGHAAGACALLAVMMAAAQGRASEDTDMVRAQYVEYLVENAGDADPSSKATSRR